MLVAVKGTIHLGVYDILQNLGIITICRMKHLKDGEKLLEAVTSVGIIVYQLGIYNLTFFPILASPVNFLVILIGSHSKVCDKYVLSVVPGGASR